MRKLAVLLAAVAVMWLTGSGCDGGSGGTGGGTQDLTGTFVRVNEGKRVQEFVLEPGGKGTFNLYGGGNAPYATLDVTYTFDGKTLRAKSSQGLQVLTVEGDVLRGSFEGGVTGETHELVYVKQ